MACRTMKYLVSQGIEELNIVFSRVNGEGVVGRAESYSCKPSTRDKRMEKSLDAELRREISESPELTGLHVPTAEAAGGVPIPSQSELEGMAGGGMVMAGSPVTDTTFGSLLDAHNRKMMIHLIEVLNMMFPDYDFSALRAHHFERLSLEEVSTRMDEYLQPLFARTYATSVRPRIDQTLEGEICPGECDVFSYIPDSSYSLLFADSLWSFNVFFYNRRLKRVVFLFFMASPSLSYPSPDAPYDGDAGYDSFHILDDDDDVADMDYM